jgi:hypothetical protein
VELRIQCLCFDTLDPMPVAAFWQEALGWRRTYSEPDEIVLEPPEGSREAGLVPDLIFLACRTANRGRTGCTST